jgi:hypothetical protein
MYKGGGVMSMKWEAPSFVEVKMDAEINAYQDDLTDIPGVHEQPTEAPVAATPNSHDG